MEGFSSSRERGKRHVKAERRLWNKLSSSDYSLCSMCVLKEERKEENPILKEERRKNIWHEKGKEEE